MHAEYVEVLLFGDSIVANFKNWGHEFQNKYVEFSHVSDQLEQ